MRQSPHFCDYNSGASEKIERKDLPREFGAAGTIDDRLQEWRKAGIFEMMWGSGLLERFLGCHARMFLSGIQIDCWQVNVDGAAGFPPCRTQAPLGPGGTQERKRAGMTLHGA